MIDRISICDDDSFHEKAGGSRVCVYIRREIQRRCSCDSFGGVPRFIQGVPVLIKFHLSSRVLRPSFVSMDDGEVT